jgi:hypothetical protein
MSLIATWFSEGRRAQHPPIRAIRWACSSMHRRDGHFAPQTRTEHEAKAAAAAAKARAALTPRSNIWRPGVLRRAAPEGPAQRSGTSVMARPEEQLAPYRPNLSLLTPYIVACWPLRSCGPLLPCAAYPGLVKAASHQFHALLQSTWHCRRRAAMQRRARRRVVSCRYGG